MSMARCSLCHCFSRNCPVGMPNHKSAPVGPNCTMNSLGRHYRDQSDTTVPVCDYEGCTFFTTDTFATAAYPGDISLGPVADPQPTQQSSECAQIMAILEKNKLDNEARHLQVLDLQKQVSALITGQVPVSTSSSPSSNPTVSLGSSTTSPVYAMPSTMPSVIANAADDYLARLGNSFNNNLGNSFINQGINSNFAPAGPQQFQPQPVTNPLAGMGAALGVRNDSQVISVDQLYSATIKCKQLRAHEFAATASQFTYKSQLTQGNCNAVVFAYGSFKHLEALASGLIPNVPQNEFLARLRHLKNVFEIACLSSNLSTFSEPSWQVAREYDSRIISDIESGAKTWEGLSNGLETDAIYVAKELVELKNKSKKPTKVKAETSDPKVERTKKDPKANGCTTYNTHRSSEGCYWESINKDETCVYEHFCSWCKANRSTVEKHKSINCEFKTPE